MKKILLILMLQHFAADVAVSQSFKIDDLVKLAYLPVKDIDHFMHKRGFILIKNKVDSLSAEATFATNIKVKALQKDYSNRKSIVISFRDDQKEYVLQSGSASEYVEGQRSLIKSGFFYDEEKDISKDSSVTFQKGNMVIQAMAQQEDSVIRYSFDLKMMRIPERIKYAEDLLQFDSHEFLASFFGVQNVKRDMYYFSEKELKKCSVLFSGTKYQVVFVWGDEKNLDHLLYILVPHVLPTKGADENNPVTGNNEWQFRNGLYPGMNIKELIRLNQTDFNIYGSASDFAYMVKPDDKGKIDFSKTAVMLGCNSCDDIKLLNQNEVSAVAIAKKDLPMFVNDVILYPSKR